MKQFALMLGLACTACATQMPRLEPVEKLRRFPVWYTGSIAGRAAKLSAEAAKTPAPKNGRAIDVIAVTWELSDDAAERLIGLEGGGIESTAVHRSGLDAQLTKLGRTRFATELQSPRLLVMDGVKANIALVNQEAYVSSFDLAGTRKALIADPRVEVAESGLKYDVTATLQPGGRIGLDVTLHVASVDMPRVTPKTRVP